MRTGLLGEEPSPTAGRVKDGLSGGEPVSLLLDATWRDPRGFFGWFCAVNHKTIARRFLVTTLVFFVLGGLAAMALLTLPWLRRPRSRPRATGDVGASPES